MPITEATHPVFDAEERDHRLIRRMRTGDGAARELNQRYFEHDEHFQQRKEDLSVVPRTRFLTSRLIGRLFQRFDDVERELGPLEESDLETAGPDGEDYRVVLLELAEILLAHNAVVIVFNPARGLEVSSPLAMPMWTGTEAVIKGQRIVAPSVMSDGQAIDTWTRYTPTGWEVFREAREDEEGEQVSVESGLYAPEQDPQPFFVGSDGSRRAPVLRAEMPWDAEFGLQIAKVHRSIMRMVSRRDFSVSAAMNGLLQLGVGDDADLADDVSHKLRSGSKAVPYDKDKGEHKGLEVPTAGAELGTEVIGDKEEALNRVAFNELEEGARTATSATEAVIKNSSGAASALSVIAAALADIESRVLPLMAQAQDFLNFAGPNPQPTGISVDWPEDFSEIDLGSEE